MDDPAVTAKQLVDLAKKHIEDQQCRIERQRELLAKYERDDDVARLSGARLVLERMQKQLAQMTAAHVAAEDICQSSRWMRQALKRSCGTPQCSASSSRSRPTCCVMVAVALGPLGLTRPSKYSAYGALHRIIADAVSGFLARMKAPREIVRKL